MTTDALPPQMEPETAGVLLRQAREAAGLTLDAVAQQLKLAPRQVEALEDGDFSRLPGRTFIRGFMRNYARLLHLDPDTVLSALPGAAAVPSLGAPTLHATAASIGELPNAGRTRSAWTRWAIPLALIAIVGGAAYFEYRQQRDGANGAGVRSGAPAAKSSGESSMALPNPAVAPAAPDSIAESPPSSLPAPTTTEPATASAPGAGGAAPASVADEATLALTYRDFSWTEIRDRSGRVLIAKMMRAGEQQNVSGTPPFDVVIGNSADVRLSYRGQPVDLAALSRGNVARFTLK